MLARDNFPQSFGNLSFNAHSDVGGPGPQAEPEWSPELIDSKLSKGEKVDLSILTREQRLAVINTYLESKNVRGLEGIGDATKGQIECIGINNFTPDNFVARLDFQAVVGASGKPFNHLLYFSANTAKQQGVIVVPVVECAQTNEQFVLLVTEWRPVLGRFVTGFTRGFPDAKNFMESKPVKNGLKELNEETGLLSDSRAVVTQQKHIADVLENTGTHNVVNAVVELHIAVDETLMKQLRHHVHTEENVGATVQTVLVKPREAFGLLEDQHSLSALAKWFAKQD